MGKLHELLAVEPDLAATATKIVQEAIVTFGKKDEHFIETQTEVKHFLETDAYLDTTENKAMVTTVSDKLVYVAPIVSRYWNAYLAKERTNQVAVADVVVDDKVLLKDVPATVLLGMETKLKEMRAMYSAIPTLQPGVFWEPDPSRPGGVYRSRDGETRTVTRNTKRGLELSPATKEHKAQVVIEDIALPVAKKEISTWSGMLSPTQKSDLLERLDSMIRAVKKARQRANNTEAADTAPIGETIFAYIHGTTVA